MLLFHAELDGPVHDPGKSDPTDYDTFLKSRPESFETGEPTSLALACILARHVDVQGQIVAGEWHV